MAEELQIGKASYANGEFKLAFRQLLPLAAEGSPPAQYAIGYMYYYGYGVPPDTISGLFWIKKSADKKYSPAIEALWLIQQQDKKPKPKSALGAKQVQDVSVSTALAADETPPPREVSRVIVEEKDEVLQTLKNSTVVRTEKSTSGKYTLQLYGSYNLDAVRELQMKLDFKASTYCWRTKHNGKDWYILTYGKYTANYLAQLAKDDLPKNVKEWKPWVRKTEGLVRVKE